VIAQRLGGQAVFDRGIKADTNNKVANELLAGVPPRKDWGSITRCKARKGAESGHKEASWQQAGLRFASD